MKTKTFVLWLLIAAFVLAPLSTVRAQSGEPPIPEGSSITAEEIAARLGSAVELQTLTDCILATPKIEGSPVNMGTYDDWTRVSVCIREKGVEGIGWSGWPGSTQYPQQHFKAWSRLIDVATNKIIAEAKLDQLNNPLTQGLPKSSFSWLNHCGPAKKFLLLLDISTRQVVNGQEVGLVNRDHSWHFTLPEKPCVVCLPIITRPAEPLTCEGWTSDIQDYDGTVVSNFGFEISPGWADTNQTLLLYPGEVGNLKIYYRRQWSGHDLSGHLEDVNVYFRRQDNSKFHDIQSRFVDDLAGPLYASDMDNEITKWWWLEVLLELGDGNGQHITCRQRIASIDPVIANQAKILMNTNPRLSWEQALELSSK